MVSAKETRTAALETQKWSFSADGKPLSLDEFLETYKKQGTFFEGKEQWLKGVTKVSWENFFLVCTEELDDISQRAAKMLIQYCLEIVEEVVSRTRGPVDPTKIAEAMKREFDEQYDNRIYQFQWAMRHDAVREAVTNAVANRWGRQ
jgi:regulator of PEP synthase PpsR (kinase-PPPase family)